MKLFNLRRPKIAYSPSYVDYILRKNEVLLLEMGHTGREGCTWEVGLEKENKNLNVVDVLTV
jgi:hypothetical protein